MILEIKNILLKIFVGLVSIATAIPINAVIFGMLFDPATAEIGFENKTNLTVNSIDVKFCDKTKHLEQILPGAKVSVKFEVSHECSFIVRVLFSNDHSLKTEVGYVTSGWTYKFFVQIENDRLVETDSIIEADPNYTSKTICLFTMYILIAALTYKAILIIVRRSKR